MHPHVYALPTYVYSKKLTFNEAAAAVIEHARSPSTSVVVSSSPSVVVSSSPSVVVSSSCEDSSSKQLNFIAMTEELQEYYTIDDNGNVTSWRGPLVSYDMTGWKRVRGGFIRPTPACPCQGMAVREPSTKFEWKPGMKDLIRGLLENHNASSAPCEHIANQLMLDGRWSDLDCPSKSQVKNFVQAHFSRKKQDEQHALRRRGKRSYNGFSLTWLKDEILHRNMKAGRRKIAGCIKLLEQHDDEHEDSLTEFHCPPVIESNPSNNSTLLGFAGFRKSIESRPKCVPWLEWYRKECAYQNVEASNRVREMGMVKLLHAHYLEHDGYVKRHDGDHIVDGEPVHKLGDKVEVLWQGRWYPAIVIKSYTNHTWDVEYPPPADQVFCKRLPTALFHEFDQLK